MACNITKGRSEPCKDTVGGIQAVYFIDFGTLGDVGFESNSDEINDFDGNPSGTAVTAFKYQVKGNSGLEQTVTTSRETGTTFYDQVLTLVFKKLSVQSHDQLALIAVARPHVVVEDNNGNFFMCGLEFGCDVNGGTVATGTGMGEMSGYSLTLQGMEKKPANFLKGGFAGVGITVDSSSDIDDI